MCEYLFLVPVFYSIGLYVCVYAKTTLLFINKLCSKFWNQEMWVLQKIVLSIYAFLKFHINFRLDFSVSVKNIGILVGIALDL